MPEFFVAFLQVSGGAVAAVIVFSITGWLIRPRQKR